MRICAYGKIVGRDRSAARRVLIRRLIGEGSIVSQSDLARRLTRKGHAVTQTTISRDLRTLRTETPDIPVPLRSTVHDMGPVLSHRVEVVRLALEGKTTSEICTRLHHSPAAVTNYLSTFARMAYLAREGLQEGQIAFLLRRGRGLVRKYLDLLDGCTDEKVMAYHLDEMLRVSAAGPKKGGTR